MDHHHSFGNEGFNFFKKKKSIMFVFHFLNPCAQIVVMTLALTAVSLCCVVVCVECVCVECEKGGISKLTSCHKGAQSEENHSISFARGDCLQ